MNATAVVLGLALAASGPVRAQTACGDLDSLAWMVGDWRGSAAGTVFSERWGWTEQGELAGSAESASEDGSEVYQRERMSLRMVNGVPVYAADPRMDGNPVEFILVGCDERSAVFENPDHDFPQRLAYRRNDEGGLDAAVTDLEGQGFELHFRPVDDAQ